jgi:hypothetical protein
MKIKKKKRYLCVCVCVCACECFFILEYVNKCELKEWTLHNLTQTTLRNNFFKY